jgi:ABC-type glycerol-3-phosphate transport system substrate-binding protein
MSLKRYANRVVCLSVFTLIMLGLTIPAVAANVELEWMVWGRPAEMKFFNYAADLYHKENPNVRIKVLENPIGEHYKVVDLRIASGTAPDVFRAVYGQVTRYIEAKQVLDLSPYLPEGYMERFFPLLRRFVERDHSVYGLPHTLDTNVVFYNQEYLAKAGISVPTDPKNAWTWYEWGEIAAKVKAVNNLKYGAISMLRGAWPTFMNTWGGTWYDPKVKGPNLGAPTVLEGLKWQKRMYDEKIDCIESMFDGPTNADQLFALGAVGMVVSGVWMNEWLNDQIGGKFEWGATFVPRGPGGFATTIGGTANLVSVQTRHPKEAAEFLKWLSSDKMVSEFAQTGFIPPTTSAARAIKYTKYNDIMQVAIKQWELNPVELLYNQYAHPNHFPMREAQKETISLGMLGQISLEEALARFERRLQELAQH